MTYFSRVNRRGRLVFSVRNFYFVVEWASSGLWISIVTEVSRRYPRRLILRKRSFFFILTEKNEILVASCDGTDALSWITFIYHFSLQVDNVMNDVREVKKPLSNFRT